MPRPDPAPSGRVIAIVLAAGEGRRMGGPKALLSLAGTSFLAHSCRLLSRPEVLKVVAVIGAERRRVLAEAGIPEGTMVVTNERWEEGMLSSVWCGLDVAEAHDADGVLLHPVDHPLVAPTTIDRVVSTLLRGAFAAVPVCQGRRGHPGGFGREAFAALRAAPADRGARAVLAEHASRVVEVPGDAGCLLGVNTPDDYRRVAG